MGAKFYLVFSTLVSLPYILNFMKTQKNTDLVTEPLRCVSLAQTHSSVSLTLEDRKVRSRSFLGSILKKIESDINIFGSTEAGNL